MLMVANFAVEGEGGNRGGGKGEKGKGGGSFGFFTNYLIK